MLPLDVDTLLNAHATPLIDVRSPGEFSRGHIPGATNVPLFDDAERAEIGTTYKQQGRQSAVTRGLAIVGNSADRLVNRVRAVTDGRDIALHCWRGGMRSEGVSWLLEKCNFRTHVLRGGYKAFRRAAHSGMAEPRNIVILAGKTGAGKTELLDALRETGEQVIDLESLANHRGSAFGGIGQPAQPTVEQFENLLFLQWRELDPNRPVWMESESQAIGRVYVPQPAWQQMCASPAVFVELDRDDRVEFLVEQYGDLPEDELAAAIQKIRKRLGGARLNEALASLDRGDKHRFTELALEYYDKAYGNSLSKRPREFETVQMSRAADLDAVDEIREAGRRLLGQSSVGPA